jgi:NAD(P)-dependent dehydrogenase (short-subunit alcohol dehydrogenase family)
MTEPMFPAGAALIVGGSGGVGQAVCRELARAGTDVAITFQKKQGVAESLAAEIRALGRKVSVHQLTIGDAARVDAVIEEAAQQHGRLHTIVVGAGTLATQLGEARGSRPRGRISRLASRRLRDGTAHRRRGWLRPMSALTESLGGIHTGGRAPWHGRSIPSGTVSPTAR